MDIRKRSVLVFSTMVLACAWAQAQVRVEETVTTIPTYLVGDPETDPYFFTGRTYQGAAGHVYPYPIYDILTDERVERAYKYLTLGNEYTEIGVLPEIGGRIFSAVDVQTGYNFFYRQHVIRPALIGMIGSWISGGVEWNIPHHHRASSTLNTGYEIVENPDGSKTLWIGETELRQRLKWNIGLTIFPGKSYVEATFQMQNRTPLMQSFLYWANVSVHANRDYQVQFPPQTVYGTTHSKTRYPDWPYGRTDGEGNPVDDSYWANWQESNSTFAVNYTQDYLVGYDFGADAGTAHWANHHFVPGKKFFLWGTESVWNEMLTEEDGAYLELMVGTFSDNQPDYSWIGPNETRVSKQYWYPIKGIGGAKNVTLEGAVNLERLSPDRVMAGFNATARYEKARVVVRAGEKVLCDRVIDIDPNHPFREEFAVNEAVADPELFAGLYDQDGKELVSYSPVPKAAIERPHPADRPLRPEEYTSVEELLLAGQRLEEFHNARLSPLPYYEEALRRDSLDSRVNVNLGIWYARHADWANAEKHLFRAYKRLTGLHYMPDVAKTGILYHTNPKDGEMLYYLGVVSMMQGRDAEAESYFYKSTWYPGFQSAAYRYISEICWRAGRRSEALEAIDKSLELNTRSTVAGFLKAYYLGAEGRVEAAKSILRANVAFDPLDFLSRIELARLEGRTDQLKEAVGHMGNPLQEVIEAATYYGGIGADREAAGLLEAVMSFGAPYASTPMQQHAVEPFTASPLLSYMAGYYTHRAGDEEKALALYRQAAGMSPDYCFPFRLEEQAMLEDVIALRPEDGKAYYYLGNLLYYYEQKDAAIRMWEKAAETDPGYGMTFRNLGFAADKYLHDKDAAVAYYRKAVQVNPSDPKFFTELDVLEEELKVPSKERLARMDKNRKTLFRSDDATSRLVHLYVENGRYKDALNILNSRHFRVWEGGRTVYTQFVDAHLLNGRNLMARKQYAKALEDFLAAGTFPRNLETNELSTGPVVAKVAYHQGLAYQALGRAQDAEAAFRRCVDAASGGNEWLRNSQQGEEARCFAALALKALGQEAEGKELLSSLRKTVQDRMDERGSTAVDIYSKFGEDGNDDAIRARNHYIRGLVSLAEGDKLSARADLSKSLDYNPSNVWAKHFLGTSAK